MTLVPLDGCVAQEEEIVVKVRVDAHLSSLTVIPCKVIFAILQGDLQSSPSPQTVTAFVRSVHLFIKVVYSFQKATEKDEKS
jgi:hypothetical protein